MLKITCEIPEMFTENNPKRVTLLYDYFDKMMKRTGSDLTLFMNADIRGVVISIAFRRSESCFEVKVNGHSISQYPIRQIGNLIDAYNKAVEDFSQQVYSRVMLL